MCPVCFWEDDGQGDHDADRVRGGPNGRLGHRQCQIGHGPSSLVAAAELGNPHGQRSLRPGVVPAGSPGASSAEQPHRVRRGAPQERARGAR
ncbi:hypothetical protein OG930_04775 [Streptomyces sp. NBC_01799]|uniref:hypothetical protein n=1 Tax=Streptomyces sp. NBC_01800 TaxID=2975945 RepID=UPI002DD96779|nr:hypothetical protein [Streptomyces sp. NBC_01800]WSA73624.1 hypothetical protein OIE65_04865 [Streptomyces sp. NBC_01800]WSA82141.1 hypothetical protein OG930_04775 [Streptomyces sp. NBC_01799]